MPRLASVLVLALAIAGCAARQPELGHTHVRFQPGPPRLFVPAAPEPRPVPNTGRIIGRVYDLHRRPVEGVNVIVSSPQHPEARSAITNTDGFFEIPNLPPDSYEVGFYYGEVADKREVQVAPYHMTPVVLGLPLGKGVPTCYDVQDTSYVGPCFP